MKPICQTYSATFSNLGIFSKLKNILDQQTFADIKQYVTTLFKGIPENKFQECIQ